jgi:6-phosphogluconolactonase
MDADVFSDHESLSRAAAERVRALIEETLADQTDVALALAGGSTPRRLYQLLAEADLPWADVHLFWGDERVVPHDHPASNVHLVRETLLRGADVPPPNVHPMPTDRSPDAAAAAYEETLRRAFADRPHTFDLALLGMGGDGHTASLFPEDDPDPDDPRWVRAVSAPPRHDVRRRLTCTLPVFNGARHALVLVSGASKREAVQAALDDRDERLPITRVRPRTPVHWLLDRDARPSGA